MVMQYLQSVEERLAHDFFLTVGSEYSLSLASLLESRDFVGLLSTPMPDPALYGDHVAFGQDYQAWSFLRKANFLETGIDTAGAALRSFLDAETRCRHINKHHGVNPDVPDYHGPASPFSDSDFGQSFGAVIHTAKENIRGVLGAFSWKKVSAQFGFSGGASTRLSRRAGSPFYKLQGKPEVTRQAALLSVCAIETMAGWKKARDLDLMKYEEWVTIQKGSHATTVPKNAKTDRFICKEPCMNMYLQRGFGGFIRKRLAAVGIDLNDQSTNQALAREGSLTGALSTIDLKAASDSISLQLVQMLLPGDWFEALCMVRSEFTLLKEKDFKNLRRDLGVTRCNSERAHWYRLEKISSMGNGFTFELESLIFWALTRSVVDLSRDPEPRIGVYGDDLICSSLCADRLVEVLAYCGFATNGEKTFITGPFRESCGFHGFLGRDVSPFCVDEVVVGRNRVNWFLNSYNLWVGRLNLTDKKWLQYARRSAKLLMRTSKITAFNHVPEQSGLEAGLITSARYARTFFSLKRSGYRYAVFTPSRSKHRVQGPFGVLYGLVGKCDGLATWEDYIFSDDISYERLATGDTEYAFLRKHTSQWGDSSVAFGVTARGVFFAIA